MAKDPHAYSPEDRGNQDKYDVLQAREEFESMLDPRTAALQERISELEHEVEELKENDRAD